LRHDRRAISEACRLAGTTNLTSRARAWETFKNGTKRRAAQSMLRSKKWSWLKAWAMQIARRRGVKKAIVALARRLAVIMHRIWIDGSRSWPGFLFYLVRLTSTEQSAGLLRANEMGYALGPKARLTTMAAMPASTALATGDLSMSTIGLEPAASC
jgi:hypothetical protein